jgi:uncharacterized membrane protein
MPQDTPVMPEHVENTVRALARMHADHYEKATPLQRIIDRLTAIVGRPRFIVVLTIIMVGWMLINVGAVWLGREPWDEPPFSLLEFVVGIMALYTALLIMTTQRREDQLTHHRDRLTLELAILNEQKSAKIIQLLEELRRDTPYLANRVDDEANAMAAPSDPHSVHIKLQDTHAEVTPHA